MLLWISLLTAAASPLASADDLTQLMGTSPGRTVDQLIGDPGTLEPSTLRALDSLPAGWAASLNRMVQQPPEGIRITNEPDKGMAMSVASSDPAASFSQFYQLFRSRLTDQQLADLAAAALTTPGTRFSRSQSEAIGVPAALAALAMSFAQSNGSLATTLPLVRPGREGGLLLNFGGAGRKLGASASPVGSMKLETGYRTAGGATYVVRSSIIDIDGKGSPTYRAGTGVMVNGVSAEGGFVYGGARGHEGPGAEASLSASGVRLSGRVVDPDRASEGPQGSVSVGLDAVRTRRTALGLQVGVDGIGAPSGETDGPFRGGSAGVNLRTHPGDDLAIIASASVGASDSCHAVNGSVMTGVTLANQWNAIARFSMGNVESTNQPAMNGQISFEYTPARSSEESLRDIQRIESEIRERVTRAATLERDLESGADTSRYVELQLGSQRIQLTRLLARYSDLAGKRGTRPTIEHEILEEARRQARGKTYGALVWQR